ncbi:MAG TPA: hypothetical protein VFY06_07540 [Verrucomicrobiae bacterium]|nr:hypothetical protein [Verrucomicrobiae bacterium]
MTLALISICFVLLISCSRNNLPAINNAITLHKDCAGLFQQHPTIIGTNLTLIAEGRLPMEMVNAIPTNSWPLSVQNLKPFVVKRDNFGIYIWIRANKHPTETISGNWIAKGYFVSCTNFAPFRIRSNVPWFKETGLPEIYEVSMPAKAE